MCSEEASKGGRRGGGAYGEGGKTYSVCTRGTYIVSTLTQKFRHGECI